MKSIHSQEERKDHILKTQKVIENSQRIINYDNLKQENSTKPFKLSSFKMIITCLIISIFLCLFIFKVEFFVEVALKTGLKL